MVGSQLSERQNVPVLLEEAREQSANLVYHHHPRARLEARLGRTLHESDRQTRRLRADRSQARRLLTPCRDDLRFRAPQPGPYASCPVNRLRGVEQFPLRWRRKAVFCPSPAALHPLPRNFLRRRKKLWLSRSCRTLKTGG